MTGTLQVGRVLSASTSLLTVGCRVSAIDAPALGALVRAQVSPDLATFGLISDIRIADDGLVRQLVTADTVSEEVVRDNRERRIVPVEISVVVVGHERSGNVHHTLPPRPPLSLDAIYLCGDAEILRFTSLVGFKYFQHILRHPDIPHGEVLAAHIRQARNVQPDPADWAGAALHELISLLRDDYATLSSVLNALDPILTTDGPEQVDT